MVFVMCFELGGGMWQDMDFKVTTVVIMESRRVFCLLIIIRVSNGNDTSTFSAIMRKACRIGSVLVLVSTLNVTYMVFDYQY